MLLAAEMYEEWDEQAGEGVGLLELFNEDDEDGYEGDAEAAASAAA